MDFVYVATVVLQFEAKEDGPLGLCTFGGQVVLLAESHSTQNREEMTVRMGIGKAAMTGKSCSKNAAVPHAPGDMRVGERVCFQWCSMPY